IGDDDRFAAFHYGDDGISGAQIDADDFAHVVRVLFVAVAWGGAEPGAGSRCRLEMFRPLLLSNLSEAQSIFGHLLALTCCICLLYREKCKKNSLPPSGASRCGSRRSASSSCS